MDNGIGILKSGNVGLYKKTKNLLKFGTDALLLRDVLSGKIPSRTREGGRGEGLPAMNADCIERSLIADLIIIANRGKAEIEQNNFTALRNDYRGTVVYWSLKSHIQLDMDHRRI